MHHDDEIGTDFGGQNLQKQLRMKKKKTGGVKSSGLGNYEGQDMGEGINHLDESLQYGDTSMEPLNVPEIRPQPKQLSVREAMMKAQQDQNQRRHNKRSTAPRQQNNNNMF